MSKKDNSKKTQTVVRETRRYKYVIQIEKKKRVDNVELIDHKLSMKHGKVNFY